MDPRNYLLSILHYKFNLTEMALQEVFCIDRSTINYAKKHAHTMMKYRDPMFMRHTMDVREKFPFEPPAVCKNKIFYKPTTFSYRVGFDKEMYKKIQDFCRKNNTHPSIMIRQIVTNTFASWEE